MMTAVAPAAQGQGGRQGKAGDLWGSVVLQQAEPAVEQIPCLAPRDATCTPRSCRGAVTHRGDASSL